MLEDQWGALLETPSFTNHFNVIITQNIQLLEKWIAVVSWQFFCLTQGRFTVNKAIQYTSNGYKDKLDLQISYVDEVFPAKWPR